MNVRICLLASYSFICMLIWACSPTEEMEVEEIIIPNYITACGLDIEHCAPATMLPDSSAIIQIEPATCQKDRGYRRLIGNSKEYMWAICDEVNGLVFQDSLDNEIVLNIEDKSHRLKNVYARSSTNECPQFSYIAASIDEVIEYTLTNVEIDLKLLIELSPGGSEPDVYDGLAIYKDAHDAPRVSYNNQVLFMFLNNRNPSVTILRYAWSQSLKLHNQTYLDVYYNDGRYNYPMEIYFNHDCGLLAFRDDLGTLWKYKGLI